MSIPFPDIVTADSAFVWLMHRISEAFGEHAILKGGMALKLLNCPRNTNDIDYVFVPYDSKKEIEARLNEILGEIPGAKISRSMNSKALKIIIHAAGITLQIEANVSRECKTIAMSTSSLAARAGQFGRIIRIMSLDVALSHKLAAWNERRLMRDIYDVYYLYQIIGETPDIPALLARLDKMESRLPRLKKLKSMDMKRFIDELASAALDLSEEAVRKELSPLLDERELAGLDKKLKLTLNKLAEFLAGKLPL